MRIVFSSRSVQTTMMMPREIGPIAKMDQMEEAFANAQAMIGSAAADADRMKMVSEVMRNTMRAYLDEQDVSPPKKGG